MKKKIDDVRKDIDAYYESWFRINQAYSVWAQQHGTTDSLVFMLYEIFVSADDCTQHELCRKLFLPKQTVSFLLSKLEKQGYVRRSENPKDRRNKLVSFTAEGRNYAQTLLAELEQAETRAFLGMTAKERRAVADGLRSFANALSQCFLEDVKEL